MSQRYRDVLDYEIGARIVVEFTTDRRMIVDYAVILTVDGEEGEARQRGNVPSEGYQDRLASIVQHV